MSEAFSPAEEQVMRDTFRATMMRAADVLDRITDVDVIDAQVALRHEGMSIIQISRVDRAMLGSAHLRACALGIANDDKKRVPAIISELRRKTT